VAFFGTPFKGSIMATIFAPLVGAIPFVGLSNNQLVRLKQEDRITKEMLQGFEELRTTRFDSFPLFIFWEEKKVIRKALGGRLLLGHQVRPFSMQASLLGTSND
jgi:hypothetical protein